MGSENHIPQMGRVGSFAITLFALTAGLFALLITTGCGGGSSSGNGGGGGGGPVAASLSSTIAVGTAPSAIAVDSTKNKIYVTDFGAPQPMGIHFACSSSGADIRVIDGATQSRTSVGFPTPTAMNPFAVTLDPANHTLYVLAEEFAIDISKTCARYSNGIDVLDTASLTNTKNADWYPGGDYRTGIGVNSTTGYIYVASGGVSGIVEVRNSGLSVFPLQTISVGTGPAGIALDIATNKIYVANSGSNDVSVIDGTSNSVLATITDPNAVAPLAVAVNPATNTIYVANSQSNNVTVIDGTTNAVTATIPVGTSPSGVDVDSQTNFIYVANAGNAQAGDTGNITVIDGAKHTTAMLTDSKAKNPVAVAANPVTNKIYVANSGSNNVTVIDGAHD